MQNVGNGLTKGRQAILTGLMAWSLAMLWLCWRSGIQHDYEAYLQLWDSFLAGQDPWQPENAYGPLHTVTGLLRHFGPLAPKFVIVGTMLIANAFFVSELLRRRGVSPILIVYLLAVPTNVLVVGMGIIYGLNDAMVATLLVGAVILRCRNQFLCCGVLVGVAALTKYYPLLLLPFFALDKGRIRWIVIAGGAGVFGLGFAAALAVWGNGPLRAIAFGAERGPKLLSIISALSSVYGDGFTGWLIRYNSLFVVLGVAATLLFSWKARLNWLEGVVIGYLTMLTLYKVGHQQFYIPWLFMVASLPLMSSRPSDVIAMILMPAVLLLSLYQFGYQFGSDGYQKQLFWIRQFAGFIAFLVSATSIAVCSMYLSTFRGNVSSRQNRVTSQMIADPTVGDTN
ncbi:glycosyltransferase 87 family protein [Rhodoplanes sp. Z2-YC6860]|uniref:glycosyltransferase 87 family protein n=1 Tax=Rhodoplanes sp. Z2-YC6860 TaxID=674703 RepID=UPI0008364174|nr:glycosyltransferase 87 family protein [Rhodoplanes sp. Z2-YC6860]